MFYTALARLMFLDETGELFGPFIQPILEHMDEIGPHCREKSERVMVRTRYMPHAIAPWLFHAPRCRLPVPPFGPHGLILLILGSLLLILVLVLLILGSLLLVEMVMAVRRLH